MCVKCYDELLHCFGDFDSKIKKPLIIALFYLPRGDFFSLDVEGAEIEVLKGIDFSLYNFKYILVETRSIENIKNYLESKKYNLIEKLSHHDYLFKFLKV